MEILDENIESPGLLGNAKINEYLKSCAKWGKFLAIVGFIGLGLMVILGFFFMAKMTEMYRMYSYSRPSPFPGFLIGIIYIGFALLYFFPTYYLLQFSNKIQAALILKDAYTTEDAFLNLKKMFTFIGIMTIVILSIYVLAIFIGIFAASMASGF